MQSAMSAHSAWAGKLFASGGALDGVGVNVAFEPAAPVRIMSQNVAPTAGWLEIWIAADG